MNSRVKNVSNPVNEDGQNRNRLQRILNYIKSYSCAVQRYRKHLKEENNVVSYDANREGRRIFRYGEFIAHLVEEYVQSGQLEEAQKEWVNDSWNSIRTLSRIEGMGPIRAAELVEQGINSVEDLFCNTDKLTRQQIIGLEHFQDLNVKIPLTEVTDFLKKISSLLEAANEKYQVFSTGDGRRCRPKCNQVDCLLIPQHSNTMDKVLKILQPIIVDVICVGSTKFKGICRLNDNSLARKLTIRSASTTQLPFLLLYHTGPINFVKKLTKEASNQGLKLSEHSMRKIATNESVMVTSEEEIFHHIGVAYVPPESRVTNYRTPDSNTGT